MRLVGKIATAVAAATLWTGSVQAGEAPDALAGRVSSLEESIKTLRAQLDILARTIRSLTPPSPIEDVTPQSVDITGSAVKGSLDAHVVIIEFSDFQCPFCGRHAQGAYRQLDQKFVATGRVRYAFRNLPLDNIHPQAAKAAEAAECAADQGQFWAMHDQIFSRQQALEVPELLANAKAAGINVAQFEVCLTSGSKTAKVSADRSEARRLGLEGTPAFLIGQTQPDNTVLVTKRVNGAVPFEVFDAALQQIFSESK